MSAKIQPLGPLSPFLTGEVFDFLFPVEIAQIINRVQRSWSGYMSSGLLDLRSLPITDRQLTVILTNSRSTYPNKPLTRLVLDYCTRLTFRSGQHITQMQTSLTHLSLAETTHEEESDVASGLGRMPNLVYLDLSGVLGWNPEVIAQYSSLKELILKDWCWDEAFQSLSGLALERLDISNNLTMTQESVPYINSITSLKVLDITDTCVPAEQVKRSRLRVIDLTSRNVVLLTSSLTDKIFDFLSPKEIALTINRVQSSWSTCMPTGVLNLSSLPITDRDLTLILGKSCKTYPLTRLFLDRCYSLTARSGAEISKIQTLTHLSLNSTIAPTEEEDVAAGLQQMSNLEFLDLSDNSEWRPEVIAKCSSLKTLILKGWCGDEMFQPLQGLSLEVLDVSNNIAMSNVSVPILNRMTSLKVINISNTRICANKLKRSNLKVIHS